MLTLEWFTRVCCTTLRINSMLSFRRHAFIITSTTHRLNLAFTSDLFRLYISVGFNIPRFNPAQSSWFYVKTVFFKDD